MIVVPLFDDKDCVAMMTWTIMAVVMTTQTKERHQNSEVSHYRTVPCQKEIRTP